MRLTSAFLGLVGYLGATVVAGLWFALLPTLGALWCLGVLR